jgi:hypothetical protein
LTTASASDGWGFGVSALMNKDVAGPLPSLISKAGQKMGLRHWLSPTYQQHASLHSSWSRIKYLWKFDFNFSMMKLSVLMTSALSGCHGGAESEILLVLFLLLNT